jgi:hypothetical protein
MLVAERSARRLRRSVWDVSSKILNRASKMQIPAGMLPAGI